MIRLAEDKSGLIAFVLPTFACAGAQRDIILLANALVARGISVAILVLRHHGPLRSLVDPKVRVVDFPGQRVRYAIPGLRRAIRELRPRYLLSSGPNLNLLCLTAVRSLPRREQPKLLLREVNTPSYSERLDPRWQDRIAYRFLHRFYRNADCVVTLTDGSCRELIEQFAVPASKVAIMRANAVITQETSERIASWDREQGREADLIVAVGRLSSEKDFLLLLRALALVGNRRPWRLALVGEGDERPALEEFARSNGLSDRINFVGFDADAFGWLMRAKVMVCSSVYEGLGNVIIEALGCGTPVVSTNCPYGPGEILQQGRYGTLVPVGDAPALAAAIEQALDQPVDRATLIERALNYTADRAADNFLDILASL